MNQLIVKDQEGRAIPITSDTIYIQTSKGEIAIDLYERIPGYVGVRGSRHGLIIQPSADNSIHIGLQSW